LQKQFPLIKFTSFQQKLTTSSKRHYNLPYLSTSTVKLEPDILTSCTASFREPVKNTLLTLCKISPTNNPARSALPPFSS